MLFGSPGQGNYAAANAFLDALAHHRQWAGRPALAVNWGSWSEVGMAAASRDAAGRHWEELGMGWIDPPRGLRTLGRLLRSDAAQAAVLPVDWSKFFERVPVAAAPPFLAEMGRQTESGAPGATTMLRMVPGLPSSARLDKPGTDRRLVVAPSELLRRLQEAEPGERQEVLLAEIRRQVALVLGNDPSNLPDPHRPLHELGFDSLAAVELCNALGRSLGKHLPPTMLFDYSTLDALSGHLIEDVLRFGPGAEGGASASAACHWRDASATVPPGEEAAADKPPLAPEEGDFRAEALAQVEGLSDEDMESLIAEEIAKLHQQ